MVIFWLIPITASFGGNRPTYQTNRLRLVRGEGFGDGVSKIRWPRQYQICAIPRADSPAKTSSFGDKYTHLVSKRVHHTTLIQ
uniref:Uncharacterized protein n=1 Tax=Moorena producens (strain JHB) TaxID=1454205 RepID=A0A1D9FWP6_MOOP1